MNAQDFINDMSNMHGLGKGIVTSREELKEDIKVSKIHAKLRALYWITKKYNISVEEAQIKLETDPTLEI